jgi:glycosyltransferase 2 family protein
MTDSSPESLHPRHATRPHKRIIAWLKQRRSRVLLWLRLIVSVILMALVVSLVLDNRDKLHDVNWNWIPLAWLLMLTSTLVKALRWSLLVRLSHMQLTYRRLLGTYLVGAFFSTVLPTSIGGDAVRAVDTAAKTGRVADSTSSVLIERGIGLLVVVGSGSVFGLFIEAGKVPTVFLLVVHGMFIGGVIGLIFLRQGWFIEPIAALMSRLKMGRLVDKVRHLQTALSGHLGHPWVLIQMLLLSIVANTLTIGATYLVLSAVTDPIALASFVPMITLITVAELIPISIAALGVKESAYIFFLGLVGVGSAEAGVTAIIMRALVWALALLGGMVYIGRTFRASPKDKTAEV